MQSEAGGTVASLSDGSLEQHNHSAMSPSLSSGCPYSPLSNPSDIRRLILCPGEARLEGALEIVSLEDDPQYAALSYSWAMENGDDSRSRSITLHCKCVGGATTHLEAVDITQNLFDALSRIRAGSTSPQHLWIDALCINQNDPIEREQQVAHMAHIFGKATIVIAWLGECGYHNFSDITEEHMSCAAQMVEEAEKQTLPIEAWNNTAHPGFHRACELQDGFYALLGARYFQRLWIVQELRHAKDVLICWNKYEIDLKDFSRALNFHRAKARWIETVHISALFEQSEQPYMHNILVCLASYKDLQCTDQRDHLYSLLSLDLECPLAADYSATVGQMGRRLAHYMTSQGWQEVMLRNCRGANPCYADGGTSSSWGVELDRRSLLSGFFLPELVKEHGLPTSSEPKIQRQWQRLIQQQKAELAGTRSTELSDVRVWPTQKPADDARTICLQLHVFGTVGNRVGGGRLDGYHRLEGYADVRLVGTYDGLINRLEHLRRDDVVCTAEHPTSFWTILRQVQNNPEVYKIVGNCYLQADDARWDSERRAYERWDGQPIARRAFDIV